MGMLQNITERINFSSIVNRTDYPDFLDIQIKSFHRFFPIGNKVRRKSDEGLLTPLWRIFQLRILEINLY
jgi:DNA-directed RNA polymerase subunit beta